MNKKKPRRIKETARFFLFGGDSRDRTDDLLTASILNMKNMFSE